VALREGEREEQSETLRIFEDSLNLVPPPLSGFKQEPPRGTHLDEQHPSQHLQVIKKQVERRRRKAKRNRRRGRTAGKSSCQQRGVSNTDHIENSTARSDRHFTEEREREGEQEDKSAAHARRSRPRESSTSQQPPTPKRPRSCKTSGLPSSDVSPPARKAPSDSEHRGTNSRVPEREKKEKAQRTMSRSSKAPSLRFLLLLPPVPALFRLSAPPTAASTPLPTESPKSRPGGRGSGERAPSVRKDVEKRDLSHLLSPRKEGNATTTYYLPLTTTLRLRGKKGISFIHSFPFLVFHNFPFFCDAKGRKEGRRERQLRSRER
jgi:hypothetical protein